MAITQTSDRFGIPGNRSLHSWMRWRRVTVIGVKGEIDVQGSSSDGIHFSLW